MGKLESSAMADYERNRKLKRFSNLEFDGEERTGSPEPDGRLTRFARLDFDVAPSSEAVSEPAAQDTEPHSGYSSATANGSRSVPRPETVSVGAEASLSPVRAGRTEKQSPQMWKSEGQAELRSAVLGQLGGIRELLSLDGVGRAIDDDLRREIQARAASQWPNDPRQQAREVERQCAAFLALQSTEPGVVPSNVYMAMRDVVARQWPLDYCMQKYEFLRQYEAYIALRAEREPHVPDEVVDEIAARARSVWPDDYASQLRIVREESSSFRKVRDFAPKGVGEVDLAQLRYTAALEYPGEYTRQLDSLRRRARSVQKRSRGGGRGSAPVSAASQILPATSSQSLTEVSSGSRSGLREREQAVPMRLTMRADSAGTTMRTGAGRASGVSGKPLAILVFASPLIIMLAVFMRCI